MDQPIESAYFVWLVHKVWHVDNPTPSLTYWNLMCELHRTEFVWVVPMDDNRAVDGIDLRGEFCRETGIEGPTEWNFTGCSLLEMLVAFSRRAAFATERSSPEWFWQMLTNLGLAEFNDADRFPQMTVDDALYRVVAREYECDGSGGGLFPLQHPQHDQRKVEIWYQFCEYVAENDLV